MSALPWFRVYHRMVDDEKLRLLAFEDRWHFVAICCIKGSGLLDEPDNDMRDRKIAVKLGVQVRELEEIARRLFEVGLVDEALNPCAWDELQYHSDNSTARVKKFREKQRGNTVKRFRNVSVTVQDTESDTDTDLEPKGSCASGDAHAVKPEHIFERWNETAAVIGKPRVRDLTPERRQLLKARIAQYSLDDFLSVFAKIEASPFLRGDTGWKGGNFDWVFKKGNFQKIIEGNYDG